MGEQFGGVGGGGAQGLLGSHGCFDELAEFVGIFSKHGVDGVGAHGEFHAGFVGFAGGFQIALDKCFRFFLETIRIANLVPVVQVIAVVVDSWHIKRATLGHFLDGGVVHVGGVFERVCAGADGVAGAIGSVGVDGDFFAELVGGVDGGFDFVVGVGLELRDIVIGAGGGVELDDIGTDDDVTQFQDRK